MALTFDSSNADLVSGFNYAKPEALQYVKTGIGTNIPSYWAGLQDRPAFYSRDVAHQMTGAHLLGLDKENYSMFQAFAASATAARKYYPLWAFGFDGSIYTLDYQGDNNFVRELPVPFDLVWRASQQYFWTGDSRWVSDPTLWTFYTTTVNDFITAHDADKDSVADEGGTGYIFVGVASYNEEGEKLLEAGDAIGAQYQAFLAYAAIQQARGDSSGASQTLTRARNLKTYFNSNWFSDSANQYIRGFNTSGPVTGWGKENSFFMPMTLITNPGFRTRDYLSFIDQNMGTANVEARTYAPELFFSWGRPDAAAKYMLSIINDSNKTYPEVSYTYIGNLVTGLLGVEPNAPANRVATLNNLPSNTQWASVGSIPLGGNVISVRQDGNTTSGSMKTTLSNDSGSAQLTWEARFYGQYPTLLVNGVSQPASVKVINGLSVAYINTPVPVGQTVTVATPSTIVVSYEAEDPANTLTGNSAIGGCPGCSGGRKIIYIGNTGSLQFNNVNVSSSGSYTLTIYYLNGDVDRSASMSINGGTPTTLTFHGNNDGDWNFTVQSLSVTVSLAAGSNTIKFFNNSAYGPDIDRITVY